MNENNLTQRKLGIFQRIRKAMFIRRMSPQKALKYGSLPEYLKYDDEVIGKVLEANGDQINIIPQGKLSSAIKRESRTNN